MFGTREEKGEQEIMSRRVALFVAVALVAYVGSSQAAAKASGEGTKVSTAGTKGKMAHHEAWAPHHGQAASTKGHLFETVYTAAGFEVYVYNLDHSPATLPSGTAGTATLKMHDGTTKDVPLTLATDAPAGEQSRLVGTTDLLGGSQMTAMLAIQIHGLDGAEKDASFRETYHPKAAHMGKGAHSSNPSPSKSTGSSGQGEQK